MLEAAIAEFQACGYQSASMDAIAAAAGVSKRTLYNHFSSKEALFRALAAEMGERVSVSAALVYDFEMLAGNRGELIAALEPFIEDP